MCAALPARAEPADGVDEVGGEIVVDLLDGATPADVEAVSAEYGVALRPSSRWSTAHDKLEVADVDPSDERRLLDALRADPRVEDAEPMALYRASFVPDDPLYASQWHLARVGATSAWDYACGAGVTVAVIDTGVACFDRGPFSRGSDLAGTRCDPGYNFVDESARPSDDNGHGTHVAGTIAQTTSNGVGAAGLAFCATLLPVKVLTRQGFGTVAAVAEGIRWAADEGAQVINLSLGGPLRSRILQKAVEHALDKGVVVVAAAGNSGGAVGYPAAYPGVIAVAATDESDALAPFSSRGAELALAAPGVHVTQQTVCNGGRDRCELFATLNGTSMAAPHVAGVAAMIEGLGVTERRAVREAMQASDRVRDDPSLHGAGIVDAAAAVRRVYWRRMLGRGTALAALAWLFALWFRRLGGRLDARAPSALAALATSVGLAPFAPLLGLLGKAGWRRTVAELAIRPVGEWDVLVGVGVHRWLPLASALPAVAIALLSFRHRTGRLLAGGAALGTLALFAQMLVAADVDVAYGALLAHVWVVSNAIVCLWLARVALYTR
jgi:serine protease